LETPELEPRNAHSSGSVGNSLPPRNARQPTSSGTLHDLGMTNERRPSSLLQLRELGHGIHDLPGFDTSEFRSFAVRLDPHETRLPIDRSAETLLVVVEGTVTVVWRDTTRVPTELGDGDTALTNPLAVEVLLAGAESATFLALVSRG
jgi:hypothetical protein